MINCSQIINLDFFGRKFRGKFVKKEDRLIKIDRCINRQNWQRIVLYNGRQHSINLLLHTRVKGHPHYPAIPASEDRELTFFIVFNVSILPWLLEFVVLCTHIIYHYKVDNILSTKTWTGMFWLNYTRARLWGPNFFNPTVTELHRIMVYVSGTVPSLIMVFYKLKQVCECDASVISLICLKHETNMQTCNMSIWTLGQHVWRGRHFNHDFCLKTRNPTKH